jgi:hypothetical protein
MAFFTRAGEHVRVGRRAVVDGQPLTHIPITETPVKCGRLAVVPLPRIKARRPLTDLFYLLAEATRAMFRSSARQTRPKRRQHPARRETFVEQAAMAREMFRL